MLFFSYCLDWLLDSGMCIDTAHRDDILQGACALVSDKLSEHLPRGHSGLLLLQGLGNPSGRLLNMAQILVENVENHTIRCLAVNTNWAIGFNVGGDCSV